MERSSAIIFDLDDTLYPERAFVVGGLRAAAVWVSARVGLSADGCAEGLTNLFEAGVRGDTFDVWLKKRRPSTAACRRYGVSLQRSHAAPQPVRGRDPDVHLFPWRGTQVRHGDGRPRRGPAPQIASLNISSMVQTRSP